ncbi:MAG: lipopolysaccharide biosynthesis protein [Chloroflexia bacterium]
MGPYGLKGLTGRALLYIVADTLSRGSAILMIPLYTWFMSPQDYGILALASLINSFLVMLLSFGGASVVIRFYHQYSDEGERARFLGGFWLFLVIVPGAIIAAALILIPSIFGALFHKVPFHPYVELICASAYMTIAFGTVLPNLYRAREQAGRYLALSVGTMVATVAFTVVLVVIERGGASGALAAQCIAAGLLSLVSIVLLIREVSPGWRGANLRAALKYGLPLIPHFAAHWTLSISDRAILERFASISGLGIYSLAYQFGTVLQMLITSVNQAIIPAFSRAANNSDVRGTLGRLATYFYLAVALLTLPVALAARDLIHLFTPPSYHEAGQLVPFIALGIAAMGFYFIPMNLLSMTAGRTGKIPLITVSAAAINVGLNLLLVPRMGIQAAAIDTAIGYGALAVFTTLYARRIIHLAYEVERIAKLAGAALLIYALGVLLGDSIYDRSILLDLALKLTLVALLPMVLWLLGFWTPGEKAKITSTLSRAFRAPRAEYQVSQEGSRQ